MTAVTQIDLMGNEIVFESKGKRPGHGGGTMQDMHGSLAGFYCVDCAYCQPANRGGLAYWCMKSSYAAAGCNVFPYREACGKFARF